MTLPAKKRMLGLLAGRIGSKARALAMLTDHIAVVRRAAKSLLCFAVLFLPHLFTQPGGAFQERLAAELDRAVRPGQRLLGALPREHGKTTLGTVALALRELCLGADSPGGHKRNVLIVGANGAEAEGKLRQIVHEIETNALLRRHFHRRLSAARDMAGRSVAYADDEIVLAGGARLHAIGFGGKVRGQLSAGRRLDLVILDYPEDDAGASSAAVREKQADWFSRALLNALDVEHGSLVWLGTLLHHDSVLAREMQRVEITGRPGFNPAPRNAAPAALKCRLPEISTGGTEVPPTAGGEWRVLTLSAIDDAGCPLWPERWTLARLEARRREIGDRAFSQEFLNAPVSLAEQVFHDSDFRTYDPAKLAQAGGEWYCGTLPLTVVMGVDPAIGEGRRHDYFAAVVIGLATDAASDMAEPLIYVLDVLRLKVPFSTQLEQLSRLTRQWLPRVVGVEAVAYQQALAQAAWDRGLPVRALGAARSKAARIETAAVPVADGRVLLPAVAPWVAAFRTEAAEYPAGSHDDQLDALARALEAGLPLIAGGGEVQSAGPQRSGVEGF